MEIDTDKHRISNDVFKLIQPDLLSVDDLVIILKEVFSSLFNFQTNQAAVLSLKI